MEREKDIYEIFHNYYSFLSLRYEVLYLMWMKKNVDDVTERTREGKNEREKKKNGKCEREKVM